IRCRRRYSAGDHCYSLLICVVRSHGPLLREGQSNIRVGDWMFDSTKLRFRKAKLMLIRSVHGVLERNTRHAIVALDCGSGKLGKKTKGAASQREREIRSSQTLARRCPPQAANHLELTTANRFSNSRTLTMRRRWVPSPILRPPFQ